MEGGLDLAVWREDDRDVHSEQRWEVRRVLDQIAADGGEVSTAELDRGVEDQRARVWRDVSAGQAAKEDYDEGCEKCDGGDVAENFAPRTTGFFKKMPPAILEILWPRWVARIGA